MESGDLAIKKTPHGHKWMPAVYVTYFGILKEIAEAHGYALAVHGSMTRDFDLVAVPWIDNPKSHEEFLTAVRNAIGIRRSDGKIWDEIGMMPNGRYAYVIESGAGGYFDISITPTIQQAVDLVQKKERDSIEVKKILEQSKLKPLSELQK